MMSTVAEPLPPEPPQYGYYTATMPDGFSFSVQRKAAGWFVPSLNQAVSWHQFNVDCPGVQVRWTLPDVPPVTWRARI